MTDQHINSTSNDEEPSRKEIWQKLHRASVVVEMAEKLLDSGTEENNYSILISMDSAATLLGQIPTEATAIRDSDEFDFRLLEAKALLNLISRIPKLDLDLDDLVGEGIDLSALHSVALREMSELNDIFDASTEKLPPDLPDRIEKIKAIDTTDQTSAPYPAAEISLDEIEKNLRDIFSLTSIAYDLTLNTYDNDKYIASSMGVAAASLRRITDDAPTITQSKEFDRRAMELEALYQSISCAVTLDTDSQLKPGLDLCSLVSMARTQVTELCEYFDDLRESIPQAA